jgi:hypothetical protein
VYYHFLICLSLFSSTIFPLLMYSFTCIPNILNSISALLLLCILCLSLYQKQRRDEARMRFAGSHKVSGLLDSFLYLDLILLSTNQFMICRFSPRVITTIAPFHFGSSFFFFRSWSFYCNFVLEWLKAKYLAQVYPKTCKFQKFKNCTGNIFK